MMFVLGCFLLPLLPRWVWGPRSLLRLGVRFPLSVGLIFARGGANLLGIGITFAGLAIVVLPMLLSSLLVRSLLALAGR